MLAHIKDIIASISDCPRAVGAFNVYNLETAKAAVAGAVAAGCPAILQTSEKALTYAGPQNLYNLIKTVIEQESGRLPMAIHLDHGKNLEVVEECLKLGYSSVHCDASAFGFEDNVKITKEAAEMAHEVGAWVQGELGNILGKEGLLKIEQGDNPKKYFTNPLKVKEFIEQTKVDTLAISFGSFHGFFVGKENLDFELLQKVVKEVKVPLVLHGGSGIKEAEIIKSIQEGIRIINIDTELRVAFSNALKQALIIEKEMVDLREPLSEAMAAMAEVVSKKARLFYTLK